MNIPRQEYIAVTLHEYLASWRAARDDRQAVTDTAAAIAAAATDLATIIAQGPLAGDLGPLFAAAPPAETADGGISELALVGEVSAEGDRQHALDCYASEMFVDRLRDTAVSAIASEEAAEVIVLNPDGVIVVGSTPWTARTTSISMLRSERCSPCCRGHPAQRRKKVSWYRAHISSLPASSCMGHTLHLC